MIKYALALIAMLVLSTNCNLALDKKVHNALVQILVESKVAFEGGDKISLTLEFANYNNVDIVYELRKLILIGGEEVEVVIDSLLKELKHGNHEVYYNVDLFLEEHI